MFPLFLFYHSIVQWLNARCLLDTSYHEREVAMATEPETDNKKYGTIYLNYSVLVTTRQIKTLSVSFWIGLNQNVLLIEGSLNDVVSCNVNNDGFSNSINTMIQPVLERYKQ